MNGLDKLKSIADQPSHIVLDTMVTAIIETIKLSIPEPSNGFAVASSVYANLLNEIMRECLTPCSEEEVLIALQDTTEQVRELIAELTALAPELARLAKERK